MKQRIQRGCVTLDKRRGVWNFVWRENGKLRFKNLGKFPSKIAAWSAAKPWRDALESQTLIAVKPVPIVPTIAAPPASNVPTVNDLIAGYRAEKMPKRADTRRGYESWLRVHVLPRWGTTPITGLHSRDVELWLRSLDLAPKSRVHIRGILKCLFEYAMWAKAIPLQISPLSKGMVKIEDSSKRLKRPRSLSVEEFQALRSNLREPYSTMVALCGCFGLRISECLALVWSDVDWLRGLLTVERAIVEQKIDDTKTENSTQIISVADDVLELLKTWKMSTEFGADTDWIFASPIQLGKLPYSYTGISTTLNRAAIKAGIGHISTHVFRHSYRAWAEKTGAHTSVQQRLMRHADLRTTLSYGTTQPDDLREANGKIAQLALIS